MLQPSVCYLNAAESDFSLQYLAESPGCHSEPHPNANGGSFCLHISVIAPSTWTRALVGDVAAHAVYSSRLSSARKRQNVLTFLCFDLCISCCLYTNASSTVCCCEQTLCMSRCRIGIPTVYTSCDAALVNTNTLFLNILQQEICFVLFVSFYERTFLLSFGLFSCTCQCLYMWMKKKVSNTLQKIKVPFLFLLSWHINYCFGALKPENGQLWYCYGLKWCISFMLSDVSIFE